MPRPFLEPLVVDGHHDHHRDRRGDGEDDLAGDVRVRVGGAHPGRREDDEAAGDGERRLRRHQHPVDVAARVGRAGADVAETRVGLALQHRQPHQSTGRVCGAVALAMHELSTGAAGSAGSELVSVERLGDAHRIERGDAGQREVHALHDRSGALRPEPGLLEVRHDGVRTCRVEAERGERRGVVPRVAARALRRAGLAGDRDRLLRVADVEQLLRRRGPPVGTRPGDVPRAARRRSGRASPASSGSVEPAAASTRPVSPA